MHHFHISLSVHVPDNSTGCVIKRLITCLHPQYCAEDQFSLTGDSNVPHLIKFQSSNFAFGTFNKDPERRNYSNIAVMVRIIL